MIALLFFLLTVLFVVCLLLQKVHLYIIFDEGDHTISIRFLHFIKIDVLNKYRRIARNHKKSLKSTIGKMDEANQQKRIVMDRLSISDFTSLASEAKLWSKVEKLLAAAKLELQLELDFHFIDCQATSLAYGGMKTIQGVIEPLLACWLGEYKGSITLKPSFFEKRLCFKTKIHVTLRALQLVIFTVRLFPMLLKYNKSIKKRSVYNGSSNRRTNENNNGKH